MERSGVELPALFIAADAASQDGQKRTKRTVAIQLGLLVLAAAAGAVPTRLSLGIAPGSLVGGAAFAVALIIGATYTQGRAYQRWYRGRAAAESVKTLTWRYAVGGAPFPKNTKEKQDDEKEAREIFLHRLAQLVDELQEIDLPPAPGHEQITGWMRQVRSSDLTSRMETYRVHRVEDQRDWYARRSHQHARGANRWAAVVAGGSVAGVLAAASHGFGMWEFNLLGVAAAVSAAATAWLQFQQHRTLRVSYAVAEHELSMALSRLPGRDDEEDWSTFVGDVEGAISREHTLWVGRRKLD